MPRPFALALALTLALATPAVAAPQRVDRPDARADHVDLVFTGLTGGLFSRTVSWNEISAVFGHDPIDGVAGVRADSELGVLRHDQDFLWSAGTPLTSARARAMFEQGGLRLGPAREVPALWSDYNVAIQAPAESPAWLIPFAARQLLAMSSVRDVRQGVGFLREVTGAHNERLWLFSPTAELPPERLRVEPLAWQWASALHADIERAGKPSRMVLFGNAMGGANRDGLARAIQSRGNTLRLDAGNLVDAIDSPYGEAGLPETLAAIPGMRLNALVPFENELALPPGRLEQLAAAAPLVAANLEAPKGIRIAPYVLAEVAGLRVALVGIADTRRLAERGLIGQPGGWQGTDPRQALERVLPSARLDGADAIIVVTNLAAARLPELRRVEGVLALLTCQGRNDDWVFEDFQRDFRPHADSRQPLPWLEAGVTPFQVDQLTLSLQRGTGHPQVEAISEHVQSPVDRLAMDPEPEREWRFHAALEAVRAQTDFVLPAFEALVARMPEVAKLEGEVHNQYHRPQWARLIAAILRRSAGAEAALLPGNLSGSILQGEPTRVLASGWFTNEPVALVSLTGKQLAQLAALGAADQPFAVAGYDTAKNRLGGRDLVPTERYSVVTTASVANAAAHRELITTPARLDLRLQAGRLVAGRPGERVTVRALGLAALDALKTAHHGVFDTAYLGELAALYADDGTHLNPRWLATVSDVELALQQFQSYNRAPFKDVSNSHINKADSTLSGLGGKLGLAYQSSTLDWRNTLESTYKRADFPDSTTPFNKLDDDLDLTSELRLQIFKLQTGDRAFDLVPFTNASYLTEFSPTPRGDGSYNPRRQELDGALGLVLAPGGWLKELRLGGLVKDDMARTTGGFQPGAELGFKLEQPVGDTVFSLAADAQQYFLTPEDTAADLGFLGQVTGLAKLPLWGGVGLAVGFDYYLFNGKLPAYRSFGWSLAPRFGLTYETTFKPGWGL